LWRKLNLPKKKWGRNASNLSENRGGRGKTATKGGRKEEEKKKKGRFTHPAKIYLASRGGKKKKKPFV